MLFDATGVKVRTNAEWAADKQHSDLLQTGGRQGYSRNIYDPNVTLREAIQNERLAETNASQARVLVAQKYGQGSMNDLNKLNSVVLGKPEVQYDSSTGTWCTIDGVSGEKFASFDSRKAAEHALKEWDAQSQEDQPMDGKEDRYSKELIPTAPQANMGRRAESDDSELQEAGGIMKYGASKALGRLGAKLGGKNGAAVGQVAQNLAGAAANSKTGQAAIGAAKGAGEFVSKNKKKIGAAGAVGAAGAAGYAAGRKHESWRDPYIQELLEAEEVRTKFKRPVGPAPAHVGPEVPNRPHGLSGLNVPSQTAPVGHRTAPIGRAGLGKKGKVGLAVAAGGLALAGAAAMRRKQEGYQLTEAEEELLEAHLQENVLEYSTMHRGVNDPTRRPSSAGARASGMSELRLPGSAKVKPKMGMKGKAAIGALALAAGAAGASKLMGRKKEGDDGELLFDEDGEVSGDEELLEAYLRERANDDYPGDTKGPRVEPKTKGPRMFQPSEENAYKQPANARMQAVDHQAGPVPVGGKPKISVVDHHAGPVPYGKPGMGVAGKGMLGLVALGFTAAAIKKAHDAYKEEHGKAPSEEELHHQLKKDQD